MEKKYSRGGISRYIWLICAFVHWLLSFWYDRYVFEYGDSSWDNFWSVSKDDRFPNLMQSTVLYIFGKVFALLLLCFLYYLLKTFFTSLKKKIFPVYVSVALGIFFAVFIFYYCSYWPYSFSWQDSYSLYEFSVRLVPWYWHHFLTSAWYVGCLMVFPHPFALFFIQLIGVIAVMLYFFYRIGKSFKTPYWARFLILLICIVPATFHLVTQVYRNCIYAIIFMFYVIFILCEEADKAELSTGKMFLICGLSAFLSVWRTEGVLVGLVGLSLMLFKIYKIEVSKKVLCILLYAGSFILLSLPQKMGDIKYYGKDYYIVSTLEPAMNILNDENVNLSYKGAEDDLEAIEAYAPIECIRYGGIQEVRGYFYEKGHEDFNQSFADYKVQSEYLKAFARLAIHNPGPYISSQMNFMLGAIGVDWRFQVGEFIGEHVETKIEYPFYIKGAERLLSARGVYRLTHSKISMAVFKSVESMTAKYKNFMQNAGISPAICILIILFDLFILMRELMRFIKNRSGERITYLLFSILFIIQLGLITMTVPSSYSLYFYSVFYPCAVFEFIFVYSANKRTNTESSGKND